MAHDRSCLTAYTEGVNIACNNPALSTVCLNLLCLNLGVVSCSLSPCVRVFLCGQESWRGKMLAHAWDGPGDVFLISCDLSVLLLHWLWERGKTVGAWLLPWLKLMLFRRQIEGGTIHSWQPAMQEHPDQITGGTLRSENNAHVKLLKWALCLNSPEACGAHPVDRNHLSGS